MLDFDVLLEHAGTFGIYQILVFTGLCYFKIPFGLNAIAPVFMSYTPDYRCLVYPFDDANIYPNLTDESILNITTPIESDGSPNTCRRYDYNASDCAGGNDFSCVNKSVSTVECSEFHYDDDLFTETVVTEFNLVCDRSVLNSIASSSYMVGMVVGSLVFGNISDRFGRKITLIISAYGMLLSMLGVAYSNSIVLYSITRFFVAVFGQGCNVAIFTHILEIVGNKWRTFVGMVYQSMFAIGYMIWSGIAYLYRDWHQMQLGALAMSAPLAIIVLVIPESPRWLFTTGNDKQGKHITTLMAKLNKVELDESTWTEAKKQAIQEDADNKHSTIDLFRYRGSRIYTLKIGFNWAVNSMVYYGVSLNAASFAGNIFMNNIYAGILEIACYTLCVLTMDRVGRRLLLTITLTGAGVALLVSTIINEYARGNISVTILAFTGKTLVSGSFAVIYNFTGELYPTVVRSNAIGFGSMCARIGSILSPFIIELQNSVFWLPNAIFGSVAVIGGLMSLTLRDTTGHKMMETMEEAELFYAGKDPKSKDNVDVDQFDDIGNENKALEDDVSRYSTKF